MRKVNYLFGALALGLGMLVGTLGVSLFTGSSFPATFIAKLHGQDNVQTVSGTAQNSAQPLPEQASDSGDTNNGSGTNSSNVNASSNLAGQQNDVLSPDQNGTGKDTPILSPLQQQIIADYKQDIGIFFGAWKSADEAAFRVKLAKAYTGDLLEKHAHRAEGFLAQGIGLDVSQITFDRVDIESSDDNTATLLANYRYTARDYSLADAAPVGEEHEQIVHMRVNLVKQNSHWMITGETTMP